MAGDGVYLIDRDGRRYLDASGGAAVSCLGHSDRAVLRAHMDADCPETRVILVRPRTWPTLSARFSQALPMPRDVLLKELYQEIGKPACFA